MRRLAGLSLLITLGGCGGTDARTGVPSDAARAQGAAASSVGAAPTSVPAPAPPEVPEGKLVTIRGHYVADADKHDYYSANMTQNLFDVVSIDGKPVSRRAELVDPPTPAGGAADKHGDVALVGYFFRAVATGSLVEGFDPRGTQGHAFSYALKFKVKPRTE